jgi:hypothetical protein
MAVIVMIEIVDPNDGEVAFVNANYIATITEGANNTSVIWMTDRDKEIFDSRDMHSLVEEIYSVAYPCEMVDGHIQCLTIPARGGGNDEDI